MMHKDLAVLLAQSLPGLAPLRSRRVPGGWRLALLAGERPRASVEIDGDWGIFRLALPRASAGNPFESILRQCSWQGGVKLVVARSRLALRAEVPLIADTAADREWLSRQVRQVLAGLRTAIGKPGPEATPADVAGVDMDLEMLAERCHAAGWPAVVKADGEVRITVESRSIPRTISIVRHGHALRAAVTLASGDPARGSVVCRQAAGAFLLRASASLRWVRAWASGCATDLSAAGLECLFDDAGEDAPLVKAIDALATACDLFGCEAETLFADSELARRYLDIVGPFGGVRMNSAAYCIPSGGGKSMPVTTTEVVHA